MLRVEAEIRENKQKLKSLNRELMRENAKALTLQVKFIEKTRGKLKVPALTKTEKQIIRVNKRIKKESEFNAMLDTWGVQSHVVTYTIKCRLMEDLIDCAQRCKIRPDAQVERELYLMRRLRDQTWDDLTYFLREREKYPWRTWDSKKLDLNFRKEDLLIATFPDAYRSSLDPDGKEAKVMDLWYEWLTQLEMDHVTFV